MGHKNRTIRITKLDNSVSLSQASTSIAGSSFGKRSRIPPHQNSEGQDRCQQDYYPVPYFLIGPPMPGLWGPPPMTYPPCPPWPGWYEPWDPPPMQFLVGWSGPIESFGHGGYYTRDGRYRSVGHQQDRIAPRQENWMVWNPKPNGLVSPKIAAAFDQQNKWWVPKDGASASG
jgi:hypothetical protein